MNTQMKVKSLSLGRKTQTPPRREESSKPTMIEDNQPHSSNLDAILNSPIARPSCVCSTPKPKNVELMEDSPDQDYNASPTSMFPCTQDSMVIAWDWQSNVNEKSEAYGVENNNKNNGVMSNTPKRPQKFLQKKRIPKSGSPLMNFASKRKIVNNLDVAASIAKFAAELKTLSDTMNAIQNEEREENDNGGDCAQPGSCDKLEIHNMATQKGFDIHEAETLEVSIVAEPKNEQEKQNSSVDDLFDDSIDACMVQCSQEVENKLRLSSDRSKIEDLSNEDESGGQKMDCAPSTSYYNENIGNKIIRNNSNNNRSPCKAKSFQDPNVRLLIENDIPISQIPDDSFDECFFQGFDEADELLEKFCKDEKLKDNINADRTIGNNLFPGALTSKSSNVGETFNQNNQVLNASSNFKRKQQCLGLDNTALNSQNRKFFKAKSLSDSSYLNSNRGRDANSITKKNSIVGKNNSAPVSLSKSTSNYNLNSKNQGNEILSKVSSTTNLINFNPTAGGRDNCNNEQTTSRTVSYSYLRISHDNLALENLNSNEIDLYEGDPPVDKPLSELRTTAPTSSQQMRCTAEEIEKKRLEAKMKLEKNRLKKLMNSNKTNAGVNSLPNKRPVLNNKR